MEILTELQKIEQRLDQEGDTSKVRKDFWRIVGQIKRKNSIELDDEIIERTTAIRNRLFKQDIVISVGKGLALYFLLFFFSFLGYLWVLVYFETTLAQFIILPSLIVFVTLNFVLGVISIFVAYGSYPLGRYFGGCIARVKFEGLYRYSPGELGLKIEYRSYLRTTSSRRKWVFGFPIIWVFGILFILLAITWVFNFSGIYAPLIIIIMFAIFYVLIYFRRIGELYRFVRELRIAREVKRNQ
ncbi:MAG: hypothetical protein ACFFDU_09430 [Candidatus Thorarchaeota archaeon]